MYNPQIQYACDMTKDLFNKHAHELYYIELVWERIVHDGKLVQVVPVVMAEFKR
jgi:hypothetical protein